MQEQTWQEAVIERTEELVREGAALDPEALSRRILADIEWKYAEAAADSAIGAVVAEELSLYAAVGQQQAAKAASQSEEASG